MLFFAKYLSLHLDIQPFAEYAVTPCMGVWIETQRFHRWSTPRLVTPCMGVWIETWRIGGSANASPVTPCMGVWIETDWLRNR